MTDHAWLKCADTVKMLEFLNTRWGEDFTWNSGKKHRFMQAIACWPESILLAAEKKKLADALRCIVGSPPFHPIQFDANWRSATVAQLADSIDTDRAFERMPILGDALEDAGCDSPEILNHCRQPGIHVRGCWVVDLVVGKE